MCCYLKRCQVISLCAASLPGVSKYKEIYIDILTEAHDSIMVHTCSHIWYTCSSVLRSTFAWTWVHGCMRDAVKLSHIHTDTHSMYTYSSMYAALCTRTAACMHL